MGREGDRKNCFRHGRREVVQKVHKGVTEFLHVSEIFVNFGAGRGGA